MQIFNIQRQNNYIIFNGKIPAKKAATSIAMISSVALGEASLTENNNLYNKYADDDKKIEEYLRNAIQTQERISKQKMAEDIGIGVSTCRHKTEKGRPLYELWEQTNHAKKKKKNTAGTAVKRETKSDEISDNILQIIIEAYKTKTPLTYSQIGEKLGISSKSCRNRIRSNNKLTEIWKQMEHPSPQESDGINEQIEDFIQESINKGNAVNKQMIADKLGITKDIVQWRIKTNPQLKSLMAQAGYSKLTEESQVINRKIEEILKQSIIDGILVGFADIAEKIGLSISNVNYRLNNDSKLRKLWQETPHLQRKSNKKSETLIAEEKLKQLMKYHTKENLPVHLKELASKIGISYDSCLRIVSNNIELKELWQNTPKKIVINGAKENVPEENKKIISIMEKYLSVGAKVNGEQVSKEAGISLDVFYQRTKRFSKIGELWRKLKDLDKQASDNIDKQIENALNEVIQNQSFISNTRLAKQIGIAKRTCADRISKNEYLSELWLQVEAIRNLAIKEKQNKIKNILERAIASNQTIRRPEIAKEAGIGIQTCFQLILTTPELKVLWNKIDKTCTKADSKELTQEIEKILTEANSQGQQLTISKIAYITDAAEGIVKDKLIRYPKLNELWKENKKVNYNLLKQIHSLKQNNMSNDIIQAELDLEDDVFENLMAKYIDISGILDIHHDKNISDEEYISWAILSTREYELIVTKIFEKMGYNGITTRFLGDGGVDIIAEKDGKSIIIECIHNIKQKERAKEVLALEGVRVANNIDNAILVTASGVLMNAEDCVKKINNNNPESFKVLNIEDMIKLARKNNIDINSIDFNDFEDNNETLLGYDTYTSWFYKKSDKISDEERKNWQNMPQREYEKRIIDYFINRGFQVNSLDKTVGLNGFYLLQKDKQKIVINCGSKNVIPKIDDIRSLYGSKNVYNADKVLLIGTSGISSSGKCFIDSINKQKDKNGTFEIISFDKIIELFVQKI